MKWCNKVILCMAVAGMQSGLSAAFAQTFQTYHCADGTQFIVGFYPHDPDAYLQIDGRPVILKKRLALFGARYSGSGVTLRMTRDGRTLVKHFGGKQPANQEPAAQAARIRRFLPALLYVVGRKHARALTLAVAPLPVSVQLMRMVEHSPILSAPAQRRLSYVNENNTCG